MFSPLHNVQAVEYMHILCHTARSKSVGSWQFAARNEMISICLKYEKKKKTAIVFYSIGLLTYSSTKQMLTVS
mgnify:CR=1 FL=1